MLKRILVALGLLFVLALPVQAQVNCPGLPGNPVAFAFETITVSTTAIGPTFSTAFPAAAPGFGAMAALITTEGEVLRYTLHGTNPTTTSGHQVPAASERSICGSSNVSRLRMIRDNAVDVTVTITYFR